MESHDMRTVQFKAGDTILEEGEQGATAYLIRSGSVEVTVGQGSKSKTVASLSAGEVFGEMSLIEPGPRSATVTATSDTECQMVDHDAFIASIQDDPAQAAEFMKTLVRRLRQMNELMAGMDPRRRSLGALFRDWQKSMELPDDDLPEEEARRRAAMATCYWPMI
jgi:CRP-like cAMP-binding protein